jgi:UDP-N-acetylglucosamine diphosphorylase/glucosamine-1-phosphate N-acetyltransferase
MSEKNVVIFEDNEVSNFNPLTLTRPAFELICGMTTIRENIINRFYPDAEIRYVCRSYLRDVFQQRVDAEVNDINDLDSVLFVNGRILAAFSELPPVEGESEIGIQGDTVVYARLKSSDMKGLLDDPDTFSSKLASLDLPKKEAQGIKLVSYLWELISQNGDAIRADFDFYANPKDAKGVIEKGAFIRIGDGDDAKSYDAQEAMELMLAGKLPLYLGEGARIKPNVMLDLTEGPIYIGAHTNVRPPTIIDGPCCMMDNEGTSKKVTIIDGAKIREGVTLGPVCRAGGEVEESIVQGYSNKHHSGFLGHAYVGEWVNIGAMATNSDLKNDLTDVKVPVNGNLIDTGDLKVGCSIGDHTKLGIGALLTTGTVVGIMTNVLASGSIPPQYIPSFCFYREDRLSRGFRLKSLIETAERVMGRRNVTLTPADAEMLEKVYEMVKDERDAEIDQHNRKADVTVIKIIRQYEKDKKGK